MEDQNYTCTGEQRAEVLHMTLSVDIFNSSYLDNEGYYTSMNIVSACDIVSTCHYSSLYLLLVMIYNVMHWLIMRYSLKKNFTWR